jgi:polyhydroxybutyrate depolymerase
MQTHFVTRRARAVRLSLMVGILGPCWAGCANQAQSTQAQQIAGKPGGGGAVSVIGGAGSGGVAGSGSAGIASMTQAGSSAVAGVGSVGAAGSGGSAGGAGSAAASAGVGAAGGTPAGAGASGMAGVGGAAGSSGPAEGCPSAPLAPGDHTYMINSANGQMYSYIINVPKTVDPTKRTPLIVHWHALSSDPEEARSLTSIDAKGEAAAVLVVHPRSPDKSWDVGSCCTTIVNGKRRDETVFVRELIKDVKEKACVDEHRIYTTGFSNGGMLSQMLSCTMTDVFAAAAPSGSTLTSPKADCKPSRPIPIFMINGTADPLVGYNSPGVAGGLSVPDDVKHWADANKCTGMPEMFMQKGKATCSRYTQCAAGAEVAFCAVEGMGHCVPGMKKESATNCLTKSASGLPLALGMPNDDIDGIQMNVDFLMRFTLP